MKLIKLLSVLSISCSFLGHVHGQRDTLEAHLYSQSHRMTLQALSVPSGQAIQPMASSAPAISYGSPRIVAVNQQFDWSPSNSGGGAEFGVTVEQTLTGYYNPMSSICAPDGTLYIANAGYHSIMKR
ncbi:hypothetical protein C5745_19935, partial [Sphingobacterium haloxyli]